MTTYARPASLDDALTLVAGDGAAPLGGGTDLAGQADRGIRTPTVLDPPDRCKLSRRRMKLPSGSICNVELAP